MNARLSVLTSLLVGVITVAPRVHAQPAAPRRGMVDIIKVHGVSLEGNLEGDTADRQVSIYLPPTYQTETTRRYPVIYLLHGYTDSDDRWFGRVRHFINVPEVT